MKNHHEESKQIAARVQALLKEAAREALKTRGWDLDIDITAFLYAAAQAYDRANAGLEDATPAVQPQDFVVAAKIWVLKLREEDLGEQA